jgi:hypothetical protein
MKILPRIALATAGLLAATAGQAELFRMGPLDVPSPPGHGYPQWYQDTNGLALDLCIPDSLAQLDACLLPPPPPYTFPTNWPDELFWYVADATMDMPLGRPALLTQALEAAFALGPASAGDQITFARIRIRFDAPVSGTYTVTYPYGKETFANLAAGDPVFYTNDVGIGAPGDFSGALHGAVGPYLTPIDALGTPTPPVLIDGGTFITDGVTPTLVQGSPFSTNYFEICTDNPAGFDGAGTVPCLRTDEFTVIGKIHTAPIASPLSVVRATYSTHMDALGNPMPEGHIDVFASAEAGPGEAAPDLTVGIVGGASARMIGPRDPGGLFYSQSAIAVADMPTQVTVINSADTPPSSKVQELVDAVSIMEASYDSSTESITIVAMSSDMQGAPTLTAIGLPGSPAGEILTAGSLTYALVPGTVPPQSVTVQSSAGGNASATVLMPGHSATPYPTGAPLAVDDFVTTGESAPATLFDILFNDGLEADPLTVNLLSTPLHGGIVNNFDGTVTYTPNPGYFGPDSFQYTVSTTGGLSSNIATVTIDVQQINDAPVAVDDTSAAPTGVASVLVNVVANDTDADGIAPAPGGLDPTTVQIVSVNAGGSALNNGDGTVTFTKAGCELSIPATCGFSYQVSDLGGLTSNVASVTIDVATNQAPSANADAASVLVLQSVTIDVAANDTDADGIVDLASVAIATPPSSGNVVVNGDGTVTYTAANLTGDFTFGYTIADTLGARSAEATVTVTVNPNPDLLGVSRASCRAGKNEWRVDGTSSILTPHSVTVYAGTTTGGTVIGVYPVDNFGVWRMNKNNTSAACFNFISVESDLGGLLLAVPVGN